MIWYIDGFIEIKGHEWYDRWQFEKNINVESQDSPFWCYLFGFNCGKYDDKPQDHKGIFDDNRLYYTINGMNDNNDYSFHLIGMFIEDEFHNCFGPYYIHVDDIDKIDYSQLNREPGSDYERIFNEMKEYKAKGLQSRLVCWFY